MGHLIEMVTLSKRHALLAFLLIAAIFLTLFSTGCADGGNDWKKKVEESEELQNALPSNAYIHESEYSMNDFSLSNVSSSKDIVQFSCEMENDYFSVAIQGYGEESGGEKAITTLEATSVTAKKPIDNFAVNEGQQNELDNMPDSDWQTGTADELAQQLSAWYLDGEEFTLDDSGEECSATVNKDIETWFGTVHAEGRATAELKVSDESSGWMLITSGVRTTCTRYSDELLGTYVFSEGSSEGTPDGIVKEFSVVRDGQAGIRVVFEQPEFVMTQYKETVTSPARAASLTNSEGVEGSEVYTGHTDMPANSFGCRTGAYRESYPTPGDSKETIDIGIVMNMYSVQQGRLEVEGYRVARDPNGNDIYLLNGVYEKQ